MSDLVSAPARPGRNLRGAVLWTAGILLALGLVWFVAAVAVPVWQVRAAVRRVRNSNYEPQPELRAVWSLGGEAKALRKIRIYLHLPRGLALYRDWAVGLLGYCGKDAVPLLLEELRGQDYQMRCCAAQSLGWIGREAAEAVPSLLAIAEKDSGDLRWHANEALRKIRTQPTSACDGRYAVLPWDSFPEFGKLKPVTFVEMTLEGGSGTIQISHEDGTACCLDVLVVAVDGNLTFSYSFHLDSPSYRLVDPAPLPLRQTEGFLEIRYGRDGKWVRFARKLREGERIPYPGWNRLPQEAWGRERAAEDRQP